MARTASRACSSVSAATAAMSSPWYRRVVPAAAMVETALTPGIFSAAAVSIDLILAWACGLYSITANKVPSGRVSLGYLARPDALARPSSLVILVPIKRGFSGQVRAMALGSFHRFGRVEGRLEDANIRSAPADVAVEPLPDLLERRVGVLVQHGLAGGDEPRRAVTAHQGVVLVKGVGYSLLPGVEALQGLDRLPLAGDGQRGARVHRRTVDDRRAGAAACPVANALGAGHVQPVAQGIEQGGSRLDGGLVLLAVDLERDLDRARDDLRPRLLDGLGLIDCGRGAAGQHGRGRRQARPPQEVAAAVARRPTIIIVGIMFSHRAIVPPVRFTREPAPGLGRQAQTGAGGKESPPPRPGLVTPLTNNVPPGPVSVGEDV